MTGFKILGLSLNALCIGPHPINCCATPDHATLNFVINTFADSGKTTKFVYVYAFILESFQLYGIK